MTVGRDWPGIVVEFPGHGAVRIPVGSVQSEMPRDLIGEMRVGLLHARGRGIQIRETARRAAFRVANRFHPIAHALRRRTVKMVPGRKAQAFDRHCLAHLVRIEPGVVQHDDASERVTNDADRKVVDDVEQRRQIENVFGDTIHRARRPGAVAVSAQIERVDVVLLA